MQHRAGEFTEADVAYRGARRQVDRDDRITHARLQLKLAWIRGWQDRYSGALRAITRGLTLLDGVEGPEADSQRARLLAWYGQFCRESGNLRRAVSWGERAVATAEAAGDKEALAHAHKVLGWVHLDLGDLETTNLYESLSMYEALDDLSGRASVLNMLGGDAYWRGDWDEALDRYEEARTLAVRTGDTVLAAFCTTNIGEIALDRGELDAATARFQEAARVWRVARDKPGTAFAKLLLGRALVGSGRFDDGLALLEEARDDALDVGSTPDALEATARIAECHLAAGRYQDALAVARTTMADAANLGGVAAQQPLLLRVAGIALVATRRDRRRPHRPRGEPRRRAGPGRRLRDRAHERRARDRDHGPRRAAPAPGRGRRDPRPPRGTRRTQVGDDGLSPSDGAGAGITPGAGRPSAELRVVVAEHLPHGDEVSQRVRPDPRLRDAPRLARRDGRGGHVARTVEHRADAPLHRLEAVPTRRVVLEVDRYRDPGNRGRAGTERDEAAVVDLGAPPAAGTAPCRPTPGRRARSACTRSCR